MLGGPGVYESAPMNLTSHQVLRVAAGAVLTWFQAPGAFPRAQVDLLLWPATYCAHAALGLHTGGTENEGSSPRPNWLAPIVPLLVGVGGSGRDV